MAKRWNVSGWLYFAWAVAFLGCDPPPPAPVVPVYGAACDATTPCSEGLDCIDTLPDGYCTSTCGEGDCGVGARCDASFTPALCVSTCEVGADCRDGYQCWRGGCVPACASDGDCRVEGATCGDGACELPGCDGDEDCRAGTTCRAPVCVTAGEPGALELGASCTGDLDCASGICLPLDRGGICSHPCAGSLDCADIEIATSCSPARIGPTVETLCVPEGEGDAALGALCTSDDDCVSATCVAGSCTRACVDASSCVAGMVCEGTAYAGGSFRGCRFPTADLYTVPLLDGEGATDDYEERTFALPPDVASIAIQVSQARNGGLAPYIWYVQQGEEALFEGQRYFIDRVDQPNRIELFWGDVGVGVIPNSTPDRVRLVGGRTNVGFGFDGADGASAAVQASVSVRRGADPGRGRLQVRAYFVGTEVNAARAPTSELFRALATEMADVLGQAGIEVEIVGYEDVPRSSLAVIDTVDELAELFRTPTGREGRVLSLFFVRSIDDGEGGFTTLGRAGLIGGPIDLHETSSSGVAVALDASVIGAGVRGATNAGTTAAHEIGHYLGLYHVTERYPACTGSEGPDDLCSFYGGQDPLADTAYRDLTNLMHWSETDEGARSLSEGQAFVLRHSHLVAWE